MQDDRDQLALAAKAAGKARADWDYDWLRDQGHEIARDMLWDPRRDSGQALELAAHLQEDVWIEAGFWRVGDSVMDRYGKASAPVGDDPAASLRLAIFRAAVEIGRAMP
jgi:hypothetical protein